MSNKMFILIEEKNITKEMLTKSTSSSFDFLPSWLVNSIDYKLIEFDKDDLKTINELKRYTWFDEWEIHKAYPVYDELGLVISTGTYTGLNELLSGDDAIGTTFYSPKMAPDGWVLQGLCFDFKTSTLGSLNMLNDDGTDYPHGSMLFYDAAGTLLTTQASIDSSCTQTRVSFNPDHDYGIIKGKVYAPITPTVDIRMFTIVAPDIPKAYGGNVNLLKNLNLKCVSNGSDELEAYAARFITYDPVNFSSKIHFVFNHPAGHKHELMMKVEYYEP